MINMNIEDKLNMEELKKYLNLESPQQISEFLYDFLKLKPIKQTSGGKSGIAKNSTDVSVLLHHAEKDHNKFCENLINKRKLEKARGTFVSGYKNFLTDHLILNQLYHKIHTYFWLNRVETYRSSSSNPNMHNNPKHGNIIEYKDNEGKIIKEKSIPYTLLRSIIQIHPDEIKEWSLVEVDYEGAEVKTAANLSEDEQLITDLNNDLDMHSHWTNVIFGWNYPLPQIKQEFEDERYLVKNTWTFANFYGASNKSIAEAFRKFEVYKKFILTKYNKLSKKSLNFERFFLSYSEDHIKDCQEIFYNRYSRFKEWQEEQVSFYNEYRYVETPLGFRRYHPLRRNEILNTPIQGTSFLILLSSIIEIQKRMIKNKFKSKMVGQIHDSIIFKVFIEEFYELMELVDDVMMHFDFPDLKMKAKMATEWEHGKVWNNMKKISQYKPWRN